MRSQNEYFAPS